MRDKTASKTFRAKKKLDHLLEGLLPGVYLPLYTTCHADAVQRRMVTFTRIPYAEAARRARRQDGIIYAGVINVVFMLIFLLSILL
jgi:hypothetical protein